MEARKVRRLFLEFFRDKGHKIVESYSLIPPGDDATLLFVNAGMVQFKDVFIGLRDPGYKRATSSQKCLRVSGKHNDLEEVGRTPRHHTFFEMLGNFSFGDYFKKEAIEYAWELLTKVYGLKEEQLVVTVHPDDKEAKKYWKDVVGLPESKIFEDPSNFWQMADTGPCGPCSEIHYDKGTRYQGEDPVKNPGNRFMELWNLVFMQYDRKEDGQMVPLPAPSIDTGMGLERITAVLQGVDSNYDTDLFIPLIQRVEEISGKKYRQDEDVDVAMRVIADHARATSFLIADGVFPENEGRGYILRRLMRRAIRFGHKIGIDRLFFHKVCDKVIESMGEDYPQLVESRSVIENVVRMEEERFRRTLQDGMKMLGMEIERVKKEGGKVLPGKVAFVLYDTHGFPVDLTQLIAQEASLDVDMEEFERLLQEQREKGRASWQSAEGAGADVQEIVNNAKIKTEFLGYETLEATGKVLMIIRDSQVVDEAKEGEKVWFITDRTPFYGEAGGQVGDTGTAEGNDVVLDVIDTKKFGGTIVHFAFVKEGVISKGMGLELKVDAKRRADIKRNHSGTHVLHYALRKVLGAHVRQRGSYVGPDYLRFDFSHPKAVSAEEIKEIERIALDVILGAHPVQTEVLPIEEAKAKGALAFFGDKYGAMVRMVRMGPSVELCGGTHVSNTGEIGLLKVISESGVSAGVRRIVALTGFNTLQRMQKMEDVLVGLERTLKVDMDALQERVEGFINQIKELNQKIKELQVASVSSSSGSELGLEINGISVRLKEVTGIDVKALRELADRLREKDKEAVWIIAGYGGKKNTVLLTSARPDVHAGKLLGMWLKVLGGRGGGNDRLGQGSVPQKMGLDALGASFKEVFEGFLNK